MTHRVVYETMLIWIRREAFPYSRMQSYVEGLIEIENFRQETCMATKTSRQSLMGNRIFTYLVSKYLLIRYILITERKIITLQWRNLADTTTSSERWQLTSPVVGQIDIISLLLWCTEKDSVSLLGYPCQKCKTWN